MGEFISVDHTADREIKIMAKNLEDLFKTSVSALAHLCREDLPGNVNKLTESFIIDVESGDYSGLLVDFLSEILTLSHIHRTVFLKADIDFLEDYRIRAETYGKTVDYFDEDIKAVTYHKADIRETEHGYETSLVFDI